MNKPELKQLIKECVKSVVAEMDMYDPETDTMAPGPRDRDWEDDYKEFMPPNTDDETEPVAGDDKLTQAIYLLNQAAFKLKTLVQVCKNNKLPKLAQETENLMYQIIRFTNTK